MAAEYIKGRDFISSTKLNYFHYFLKQLTGYNLHPSIRLDSARPCRVADLSTKTGIWAGDMAEMFPLAHIDAFERTATLFPPNHHGRVSDNVVLHVHDIFQPFDQEFVGQFDVVNLRLLLTLTTDQVSKLIENVVTLLKPGGYIQWIEHDKSDLHVVKSNPEISSTATEAMVKLQQNPFPNYNSRWTGEIARLMSRYGLMVLADDKLSIRPSMLSQLHELHLMGFLDIPLGLSEAVDEYRQRHMEDFKTEFASGVLMVDGFLVVVGWSGVVQY